MQFKFDMLTLIKRETFNALLQSNKSKECYKCLTSLAVLKSLLSAHLIQG